MLKQCVCCVCLCLCFGIWYLDMMVVYILLVSYGTTLYAQILTGRAAGAVVLHSLAGRPFLPLRYAMWACTCPLLCQLCRNPDEARPTHRACSMVIMSFSGLLATVDTSTTLTMTWSKVLSLLMLCTSFGCFFQSVSGIVQDVRRFATKRFVTRFLVGLHVASWSSFPLVWLVVQSGLMGAAAERSVLTVCDLFAKCMGTTAIVHAAYSKLVDKVGEEQDRLAWDFTLVQAQAAVLLPAQAAAQAQGVPIVHADGNSTGSTSTDTDPSDHPATMSSATSDQVPSLSSSSDDRAVGMSNTITVLPTLLQAPGFGPNAPPPADTQTALARHEAARQEASAAIAGRQAQILGRRMWRRLRQVFLGGRCQESRLSTLPDGAVHRIAAWVVHMETRRMEPMLADSPAAPWRGLLMSV